MSTTNNTTNMSNPLNNNNQELNEASNMAQSTANAKANTLEASTVDMVLYMFIQQDSSIEVLNVASSKVMQSYYDTLRPKEFQPSDYHEIDQERDDLDKIMEQHDGDMYGGLDSAEVLLVEQYEELLRTQFTEQDFADNDGAGELSVYSSPASHASTAVARSMLKQHLNKTFFSVTFWADGQQIYQLIKYVF